MNVKIDVDMAPEELRRLMGLPDVQEFNQKIMGQMMEKIQEASFDPNAFFRASVMGTDAFKQWRDMLTRFSQTGSSTDK